MKNFDWTQFTQKRYVKASLQTLYDAWSKPEEIESWFLSDATFLNKDNTIISKDQYIKEGYTYQWKWFLYDGTETGKVTKVNSKDHIQFTFAGNCLVDIHLESFDDGVIVTLSQKNIPTDDDSKANVRLGCDRGWHFYLVNLKSVYEGGLDLRNKDSNLKPMLEC